MEELYEFLQKILCLNRLWTYVTVFQILWVDKKTKKKNPKMLSCIFKCWQFTNGRSELHNPQYFVKGLNRTFQIHLNTLPNVDLFFSVFSRNYIKWAIFNIRMTLTLGVNITRRMTSFFASTIWAIYLDIFDFCISKT